jgi:hypothetical protein
MNQASQYGKISGHRERIEKNTKSHWMESSGAFRKFCWCAYVRRWPIFFQEWGDDKLNVPLSQLTAIWCSHVIDLVVSRKKKRRSLSELRCLKRTCQTRKKHEVLVRETFVASDALLFDRYNRGWCGLQSKKLSPKLCNIVFLMPWNWSDKRNVSPGDIFVCNLLVWLC